MKLQLIYILTTSFFYLTKCEELLIPTNYTITYFNNIKMEDMLCKTDNDCPEFSKCQNFTLNGETNLVCRFGSFLCQEKSVNLFSTEDEKCLYVNTDMWNMDEQRMNSGYNKSIKPILKTCPNIDSDDDDSISCYTEECSKNEDCISGLCNDGICINRNIIFRCSGDIEKQYMKCGRDNGIVCENGGDCYSGHCNNKYCVSDSFNPIFFWLIFGFIIISCICICFCRKSY